MEAASYTALHSYVEKMKCDYYLRLMSCILYMLSTAYLVNGHCSYTCKWQARTFHALSHGTTSTFSPKDSSSYTVTSPYQVQTMECIARSGPFLVIRIRNTNKYLCSKDTFFDNNADISFSYATPWRKFHLNPSICDVCYGFLPKPDLYIASNVVISKHEINKLKYSAIGCNRPKYCPLRGYPDVPCTGCEQQYDDGLCCAKCKIY